MIDALGIQRFTFLATDGLVVPGGTRPAGEATTQVANNAAYSPTPAQEPGLLGSPIVMIGIWAVVFIGFWFLMIRPQKRREKKLKELQSSIKAGESVVTNSGMFGRVADVGTDCFVIEMGISGRTVKIPVLKTDVLGVREPVLTPPPKESVE